MKKGMNYTIRAVVDENGYLDVKWVQGHYAPKRRFTGGIKIGTELRYCPPSIVNEITKIIQSGQKLKSNSTPLRSILEKLDLLQGSK